MVKNQPKQSRTQRLGNVKNFVRVVKNYLAKYLRKVFLSFPNFNLSPNLSPATLADTIIVYYKGKTENR